MPVKLAIIKGVNSEGVIMLVQLKGEAIIEGIKGYCGLSLGMGISGNARISSCSLILDKGNSISFCFFPKAVSKHGSSTICYY